MSEPTQLPAGGELTGSVLFYSKPEPLARELHGKLGVKRMDGPFKFAKAGHAIPLTVGEFPLAAVTGPIIFVGEEKLPIAVMGLNANENMFVQENGLFEPGVYIPAYVRRYPFVFANDTANNQMVLCVDRNAEFIVEGGDLPFFDEKGEPTQYTQQCIEFCNNFEIERQRTMSFVQLLKDLDLFETKTAQFTPTNPDGSPAEPQKIAEYFGVSEEKLNKLPTEKLVELRDNGALGQIYAHLLSLVGWDRLIAVAMARQAQQQPVAANA
ncbi:SapC family protein [Phenylobacterium sp. J426]|uniref:SapC family protein n=1 Tax=Phenylobacterium sp. J426 TaxID=2898439 RepID=UPI002150B96B|nr:SapC family protein [Phenylobacterium sp. J426]MCR5873514.1 SapC family protein [Phenylobacterium sp. J426]